MEGEQPSTPDGPEESAPTEPVAPPPPPPSPAAHQEPRRRGGPNLLVIGIIVVLIVGVLSGGGVFANSYLSNTYSPKRAVTDYFAAMAKGDVIGMMNNATFQSGDSTYAGFFGQEALTGMVALDQNKQVSNLDILSTTSVDSSTSNVKLTVSWGGTQRSLTYTVVKDTSRVHYFFYDSWRVQVPYATINVTVPVQAGVIQVDGIAAPPAKVEAIQGFHNVTMAATPFYDSSAKLVDTVDTSAPASVKFDGALSASAKAAAVAAVKANFGDAAEWMKTSTCSPDLKTNIDCPYDTYTLPANCNCYWTLEMPGGNIDAYHGWIFNFTGDPTTNMTLTITSTTNKLTATGTCTMSLVVDGSATYNFKGTWTGTLMWGGGGFSSDVTENCDAARA